MEATVLIRTFNAADIFLYSSPDVCLDTILSRRSTDNSLDFMAWFVLLHALLTVGPYIDRCVPFQIMPNQLNLPQVDSSCRNISRMISGNRMHLSSILSVMAKAVNTYQYMRFFSPSLKKKKNAKISNKLLSCCHYGVLFVEFLGK